MFRFPDLPQALYSFGHPQLVRLLILYGLHGSVKFVKRAPCDLKTWCMTQTHIARYPQTTCAATMGTLSYSATPQTRKLCSIGFDVHYPGQVKATDAVLIVGVVRSHFGFLLWSNVLLTTSAQQQDSCWCHLTGNAKITSCN